VLSKLDNKIEINFKIVNLNFKMIYEFYYLISFIARLSFCYKLKLEFDDNYNELDNNLPQTFRCYIDSFKMLFRKDVDNDDIYSYNSSFNIDIKLFETYSSLYIVSSQINDKIRFESTGILFRDLKNDSKTVKFKIILTIFKYYNGKLVEIINIKPFINFKNEISYSIDRKSLLINKNLNNTK
jgi:hypothetical protein